MNIKEFLNLVIKYKWLVLAIPIFTLLVTFFSVKDLPKQYMAIAKLSTGLLDPSRQVAPDVPNYSGPDILIKINQQFTNIIDIMTMPKNMSILSYRLILHDLKNPEQPFKTQSDDVKELTLVERQEAIRLFEERLIKKQVLTPLDNFDIKLYNLVKSMGYDGPSLSKKLIITHDENSDFITVEFTSTNTLFSVFVVNTLSNDFIDNYSFDLISNKNKSIMVLDSLLKKKEGIMNQKNQDLKDYKIKNKVLNLDKQSQIVYQQIIDNENKKSQALIDLQSLQSALNNVNTNLMSRTQDKFLGAEVSTDNQAIVILKNKLIQLNNDYVDNGFKPADKKKIDSLQQLLNYQLSRSSDNYVSDPLLAKQSLIQRRISISIDLDKTRSSIRDIDKELNKLNAKFSSMVPFDAGVQKFERDADVATKEYLDILNRYNQTNLDKNIGLRLQLEQEGVPTGPEPSKKILYMALAGMASMAICLALLFGIFTFDYSINDLKKLKSVTGISTIGKLNYIKKVHRDIDNIWKNADIYNDFSIYKSLLRDVRFQINKKIGEDNSKILGITNLHSKENNAFTTVSLAYAFARLGKQIVVIGNDEISSELHKLNFPINQYFNDLFTSQKIQKHNHITFLNNNLDGLSLLENKDKATISEILNTLKSEFDFIIIYLNSLTGIEDTKEWMLFTDKYIATFMAGTTINSSDKETIQLLKEDDKFIGWLMHGVKDA